MDAGDFFTNIGKIYVVVAVLLIIFLGLMIYLFRLDRKTQDLEKLLDDGSKT
ncbi:MAG: CcmD family protein [Saprospiraceae bacterium]|nr:CcmD family protein [Saprospiraceae bacterium]